MPDIDQIGIARSIDGVEQPLAIKRHLKSNQMRVVMVAKDGEALKEAIVSGKPSPITYNSPKPDAIMAEDKVIEKYPIPIKAEWVNIAPVTTVFN